MTIEEAKNNCKDGWMINSNEKVVNAIINRINKCDGNCPCLNDSREKKCPCSNYREKDYCCCGLYVKQDNQ